MPSWLADLRHGPAPAWIAQADSTVALDVLICGRYGACTGCEQRGTFKEAFANVWYAQTSHGRVLAIAYVICPRCTAQGTQTAREIDRRLCARYGIDENGPG
jgi:hypothetical protein